MRILIALSLLLFTISSLKAQDATTIYSYYLEIDCDHDSETNEWTSNNIDINIFLKNGRRYYVRLNGVTEYESQQQSLGSAFTKDKAITKFIFMSASPIKQSEWDKITVSIDGDDAFMIDALALTWEKKIKRKSDNVGTTLLNVVRDPIETSTGNVQTWGVNGGGAWCLSTDANDGNGSWSDTVNGCFKTVEFDIQTGKAKKIN